MLRTLHSYEEIKIKGIMRLEILKKKRRGSEEKLSRELLATRTFQYYVKSNIANMCTSPHTQAIKQRERVRQRETARVNKTYIHTLIE